MSSKIPSPALFEIGTGKDHAADIAVLTEKGFLARGRKDLPPHPFRLPFDWRSDPFGDRNWMFQLHAWRMLDPYLMRLLREPEHPRALGDVRDVIADWHRDNVAGARGAFTWYDMSTGLRALKLAWLILILRERGQEFPEPEMMDDLVDRHMAELARPAALKPGNHGLFQLNGLMALARALPDHAQAGKARAYAVTRMTDLLDQQLGAHGIHTEDAPYYHFFAVNTISRILKAPWWKVSGMSATHDKLKRARVAGDWLTDPTGRCVPIGDSGAELLRETFDTLKRWPHRRSGPNWGAVLDGYGVVRSAPNVPQARSSMLFQTASFHPAGHKHADCLSFVWQEGGQDILIDSGKYGYEKNTMRAYFRSARAHNTVEIDHEEFDRDASHAYGSGMRQVTPLGDAWLLDAEADRRHLEAVHRRCVIFRPGRFVLVADHIVFTAPPAAYSRRLGFWNRRRQSRDLTGWWHFDPALGVSPGADPGTWLVQGLADGRRLHVSHADNTGAQAASLHLGEMKPRPQGWVSRAYLEYEPAPALGFPAKIDTDYFAATLFEITRDGAAPELSLDWRASENSVTLTDGGGGKPAFQSFRFGAFTLETGHALL
jgi:hypothetical protein